jgi:hypothetical protein
MAMTGYYKTFTRPRAHRPLSMLKYDPVGTFATPCAFGEFEVKTVGTFADDGMIVRKQVLFLEQKRKK